MLYICHSSPEGRTRHGPRPYYPEQNVTCRPYGSPSRSSGRISHVPKTGWVVWPHTHPLEPWALPLSRRVPFLEAEGHCVHGGGNKGKGSSLLLSLVSLESPAVPPAKRTHLCARFCHSHLLAVVFLFLIVDGSCVLYFHKASPPLYRLRSWCVLSPAGIADSLCLDTGLFLSLVSCVIFTLNEDCS